LELIWDLPACSVPCEVQGLPVGRKFVIWDLRNIDGSWGEEEDLADPVEEREELGKKDV